MLASLLPVLLPGFSWLFAWLAPPPQGTYAYSLCGQHHCAHRVLELHKRRFRYTSWLDNYGSLPLIISGHVVAAGDSLLLIPQRARIYTLHKHNGQPKFIGCDCTAAAQATLDLHKRSGRDLAEACENRLVFYPGTDSVLVHETIAATQYSARLYLKKKK